MDVSFTATTNWNLIAGSDVAKTIETKIPNTEDFVKPHLDDILSTERAILLGSGTDNNQPTCELIIRVFPKYKIDSLTVVCTSPKIELFNGPQCEYVETIYGERLDSEDECDDIEGYRYDIEIQKSGVTQLMLKLITDSNEICIYGVQLNVAPNPNGITTLLPNSINLDNVKEMLNNSNQKLSPSAEKCKTFLETYKNAMASNKAGANANLADEFKKSMGLHGVDDSGGVSSKINAFDNASSVSDIKSYIDVAIKESEGRILRKIDAAEEALNRKLDRMLKMLEHRTMATE